MTNKILMATVVVFAGLLMSCETPTANSTMPSVSDNAGSSASSPAAVTVEGQIPVETITRTQFINALKCAKEKGDDTSLEAGFDSQLTVFEPASSEADFKSIMAAGGGGSYLIYKEASKLGCSGNT